MAREGKKRHAVIGKAWSGLRSSIENCGMRLENSKRREPGEVLFRLLGPCLMTTPPERPETARVNAGMNADWDG